MTVNIHKNSSPRLIVEVGIGRSLEPSYGPTILRRKLRPNEKFIGIDIGARGSALGMMDARLINKHDDEQLREKWSTFQQEAKNVHFVQADGAALPLANSIADEIIFSNVFGGGTLSWTRPNLLREATRIKKTMGSVVIRDTITPRHTHVSHIYDELEAADVAFDPAAIELTKEHSQPDRYTTLSQYYGFNMEQTGLSVNEEGVIWVLGNLSLKNTSNPPLLPAWHATLHQRFSD